MARSKCDGLRLETPSDAQRAQKRRKSITLFSRVNVTLEAAMSVGRSVCWLVGRSVCWSVTFFEI